MNRVIVRRGFAVVAVASAIALTACASGGAPSSTPTQSASRTPSVTATPSATPTPSVTPSASAPTIEWPTPETITCDAMLDPAVAASLTEQGLEQYPKEFTQFNFTPTLAALECPWGLPGEFHPEAYYAWAHFAPGESEVFAASVEENGYTLEASDRGQWMVTPPERAGGGPESAALITEEWVAFAPSREQVADIVWTR